MKRYVLPCVCSARVLVTTGQAGDHVRCPQCGADLPVPRLGEFSRLAEAADEAGPESRPGTQPWTAGHALLFAGVAVTFLAATAAMIVQSTRPGVIDEEVIRGAVRAGGIVDIHQAGQAFARQGVARPIMPDEAQLLRRATGAAAVGRLLWAVAAGGAIVAAAGGFAVVRRTS
jgi:hypothetical protein